jgi:hypothetical protein
VLGINRTDSPVERKRSGVLLRGEVLTRVDEGGGALDGFSSGSGNGEEARMGGGPGPVPRGRTEMGRNPASNSPRPLARGRQCCH